jgi:hypothetical protein
MVYSKPVQPKVETVKDIPFGYWLATVREHKPRILKVFRATVKPSL